MDVSIVHATIGEVDGPYAVDELLLVVSLIDEEGPQSLGDQREIVDSVPQRLDLVHMVRIGYMVTPIHDRYFEHAE